MNWTFLTLGEVAGISALAAAIAVWLYLRQPRAARLRVSTLRFWESAPSGSSSARRRKLREPWALLAQILFLLLAIAALGNPRWGVETQGRSVAIVVDAGAWSQMRSANGRTWLDDIRSEAQDLVQRLPSDDRVLILRADSDGAALVPFTADHSALRAALTNLQASSTVADIPRALEQGRDALATATAPRGLLVYIGPGLMDERQAGALDAFRQSLASTAPAATAASAAQTARQTTPVAPEFLVRLVGDEPLQNIGITRLALKRNGSASDEWGVMTQIKNYNNAPARVTLSLSVGGHVFREEEVAVAANATQSVSDDFTSLSGGLLQAEITPADRLAADNRATIVLPSSLPVTVAVVTSRPSFETKMRAVLSANPYVKTNFVRAGASATSADVTLYDGPIPAGASGAAAISFVSAPADSPAKRVRLGNWNSGHPVTRWIESRDVSVRAGETLKPGANDVVLASSSGGSTATTISANAPLPLIWAREAKGQRAVIVDFDPLDSNFTEESAFPLLMAASIEWMTHPIEEQGEFLTAGSVDLPVALSRVTAPSGRDILFATDDVSTHFIGSESGLYRVTDGNQTLEVPVNVPLLPTDRMTPMGGEAAPLGAQPIPMEQQELWRWLVALALIALWLEWRLFYYRREKAQPIAPAPPRSDGMLHIHLDEAVHETEIPKPVART